MSDKELQEFFEKNDFNVHLTKQDNIQCAEVEKWTDGGVDMIIWLNPFTIEEFKGFVEDFDIDDQIELHRQAEDYCAAFTIKESVEDFEAFEKHLEEIAEKL